MDGKISLCAGDRIISTIAADNDIEFPPLITDERVTHLLIEIKGFKPLKYMNGDMPIEASIGSRFRFNNFMKMLTSTGAMEKDETNPVS